MCPRRPRTPSWASTRPSWRTRHQTRLAWASVRSAQMRASRTCYRWSSAWSSSWYVSHVFSLLRFPFGRRAWFEDGRGGGGGGLAGEAYCAAILAHLLLPQSGCAAVVSSEQGQPVRTAWPTSSWGSLFFSFAELATDRVVFGVPPLLVPFSPPPPPPLAPDGRTQAADPATNHEYLPIDGLPAFQKLSAELILGKDSKAMKDGRVVTIQALSVRFVWVVLVGAGGVCGVLAC